MSERRTYWHLESLQRRPTEYEIATSKLMYHPQMGFELPTPGGAWFDRYQRGSPLRALDWERFADPRQTTYTAYTELQRNREAYAEGLLRSIENTDYDKRLSPQWIAMLGQVLPTLRFPMHGLQMVAAYVGHLAPAGRILIAALLQTGDEIRRIQRVAYRMRQLQETYPEFGADSKALWLNAPQWQPLRATVEKLLTTYDWGEALIALNFCVKPAFDDLFMVRFARLAEHNGDAVLGRLLLSFAEDCLWHREWSAALMDMAAQDIPENLSVVMSWKDRWQSEVDAVTGAFAPLFAAME